MQLRALRDPWALGLRHFIGHDRCDAGCMAPRTEAHHQITNISRRVPDRSLEGRLMVVSEKA